MTGPFLLADLIMEMFLTRCAMPLPLIHSGQTAACCRRRRLWAALALAMAAAPGSPAVAEDIWVRSTHDSGPGTLRAAIMAANQRPGPDRIQFDSGNQAFAEPQIIKLQSNLPPITDDLEIEGYIPDRLWQPSGVTLDGDQRYRAFEVAAQVKFRVRHLGIVRARADSGSALLSHGHTVVDAMAFLDNHADRGGAIAQRGGVLYVLNSTFLGNRAAVQGGALDLAGGLAEIRHCTLSENAAPLGAAVFNGGEVHISNSILANSREGDDCHSMRTLHAGSTHNLIERQSGCGAPMLSADPVLGTPGLYNGPTITVPLGAGSPAINRGNNVESVDDSGAPLVWDQRGNGDPRFAAGIADLGAFEQQAVTVLEVDLRDDVDLRECSRRPRDCSLRGAIHIANASDDHDAITFDPAVFQSMGELELREPLPLIEANLSISAPPAAEIEIKGPETALRSAAGVTVGVKGLKFRQK